MKTTYATSREILAAQSAQDDGEPLTARQQQIMDANDNNALVAHDEPSWRRSVDCQYVGGGYMQDSRGNYRECF